MPDREDTIPPSAGSGSRQAAAGLRRPRPLGKENSTADEPRLKVLKAYDSISA